MGLWTLDVEARRADDAGMKRIVVGIDGSKGARAALAWAAAEAQRRHVPLHVVAAWTFAPLATLPFASESYEEFREIAQATVDESVAALVPMDVTVTTRVVQGRPATTVAAEPTPGDVLVVGRRGLGGFERLLLGSVSHGVLRRSHVPTVVVPEGASERPTAGRIVVGVEGGSDDRDVVATAVEEALGRGASCSVVHVVDLGMAAAGLGGGEAAKALLDAGNMIVESAIAAGARDGLEMRGEVVLGSASGTLVDASRAADLLVVGRRSHGILGSVADACAAHADCPVLVVPQS